MTSAPDYYEILQVSPKADAEIIQAAYRSLAQKWHPDKNPGDPFAHERMKLLNEAYKTLSDARRRREYDQRCTPPNGANPTQQEPEQPETVEASPPSSQPKAVRLSYETASFVAKVIFFIGVFVFVLAHATDSLLVLIMVISGRILFFGIPAYFCTYYRMRIGLIVFALLFLIEAATSVYVRFVREPQLEKQLSEMAETKTSSPSSTVESTLPAKVSPIPAKSAQQCINNGIELLDLKEIDMAIEEFDEAIWLNPTSSLAFHKRGEAWLEKKDYKRAIKDFDMVLQLDSGNRSVHAYRGLAWYASGQPDKAIRDYDEAIRRNPESTLALSNRGNIFFNRKEYDRAIRDFDDAIRFDPPKELPGDYFCRGRAWAAKKEHGKAISDFNEAIRLDGTNPHFYFCRALVWMGQNDDDKAIRDYDSAIHLDPGFADAYRNRGLLMSGRKQYDAAVRDFNVAIRLNPDDAFAFFNRGYARFLKKNFDSAIEDLDEAIRLNPHDWLYYDLRGNVWKSKQDFTKAKKDFDEARRLRIAAAKPGP